MGKNNLTVDINILYIYIFNRITLVIIYNLDHKPFNI